MKKNTKKFLMTDHGSVKEAMRQLGAAGERVLYIVNKKDELLGSLTDGDIRRWVLSGGDLSEDVKKVFNKNPIAVRENYKNEEVKKLMLKRKSLSIPVVDENNVVSDILLWDALFGEGAGHAKEKIELPVVIMAGGRGTRLDPFTKILPKPLIPIGEKTILEIIMEKFNAYGIKEFTISINHKSKMIKAYFEETKHPFKINFIEEEEPLGTIGSLGLMKDMITKDALIVSNCDIVIESDYSEMVQFHQKRKNDITVIGSFRHFKIPYGICHIENGGDLTRIQEKPEHDYLVNTGMYIINTAVLKHIPKGRVYNATELIERVMKDKGKVGVFPLDERSWIDVGQWEEFHKAIKLLE